ncbi:MAG: hypothetical protein GVY08_13270 [Bacteroidetes bacterium]|jgi:cell division protein FtsN|nr:hypothetical protein [Bacteroidota bacterium]
MKNLLITFTAIFVAVAFLQACGQEEEVDTQTEEQAVQDSLEQAYQAELEQMRQDSIEQARADSIAAAQQEEEEQSTEFDFSDSGNFVVQVEAWRSQDKAERQAQEWQNRGYEETSVVAYGTPSTGNIWYRVRIGRFESRETAENFQQMIADEYGSMSWVSEVDDAPEEESMQEG